MKILIVDDSAADRRLCRVLLEEAGIPDLEVFEEGSAAGGLEACRTLSPECVLIDYRLPDMTGLELLEALFPGNSQEDPFAIVMLTGLGSGTVARAALEAGAHDYLMKDHLTGESLSLAIQKARTTCGLGRMLKSERNRLATLLAEKEVLLKEIHHRVKNNLAVIASMLSLQANALGDERLTAGLRASQHRVESMALIHEQLYSSDDLSQVDLAKHASMLAANLFHTYGVDPARVSWQVAMEPLRLGLDQAIPAGLILGELTSNALKHAFPNGRTGAIVIEGGRREGRIDLTVRDDGVGVPDGMEFSRPKSLGMQIVKILTRQLKGTFEMAGRPTMFKISFPEGENADQIAQSAGRGR